MIGQLIGKYRVVARLGRGGMGTVYRAVDETLERDVAIKILHQDLADREVLKRFRAEAVTLARMNHPNIATLFELTEHDGQLLMVMEFVRGETFDALSDRTGPMRVQQATQLCVQVLDALAHAHRAGIVHRDLKPANLMLAESGLVKVMDFGIARMVGTEHLTTDGYMMGTPAYMAPEQVLGQEVDGRADLYAMGVVFYRMLAAQLPFKADTGIAMVHKQINDRPTPLRQLRPDLQADCEALLAKALAKSPSERFQHAEEFKAALATLTFESSQAGVTTPWTDRVSVPFDADETMPASSTPAIGFRTAAQASLPSNVTAVNEGSQETVISPEASPEPRPQAAPAVVTVPPATPAAKVAPKKNRGRTPVLTAAAGIVILAGLSSVWVVRRSQLRPSDVPGAPAAPVTAATSVSPITTPEAPPAPPPAAASPDTTAPSAAKAPASSAPAPPARGARSSAVAATSPVIPTTPIGGDAATPVPAPDVPKKPALAALRFDGVKLLRIEGDTTREQDATLRLGADSLDLLDGDKALASAPYSAIVSIFYSHSKEPRWATPDGTGVPVAKIGGKFNFLKGDPDWITVRTKSVFIPIHARGDIDKLIAGIEERTGIRVTRVER